MVTGRADARGPIVRHRVDVTRDGQTLARHGMSDLDIQPLSRHMMLERLEARTDLEEAELRGLRVAPNDSRIAHLVARSYLAERGLVSLSPAEREELRVHYQRRALDDRIRNFGNMPVTLAEFCELTELLSRRDGASVTRAEVDACIAALPTKVSPFPTAKGFTGAAPTGLERLFMRGVIPIGDWFHTRAPGALSPSEAITCLRDGVRTRRFLEAVCNDVETLAKRREHAIEVLDAGCGGVPIMGIYAALVDTRVRVTCLELNPVSARMARAVVAAAGLQDRIDVICADAITYRARGPVDLLVSETMHSGLIAEPIVAILDNLAPQVARDGLVLPRAVDVKASLVGLDHLHGLIAYKGDLRTVRPYVDTEWQQVARYVPGAGLAKIAFALDTIDASPGAHMVYVTSTVDLGSTRLDVHDSLITAPQAVLEPDSEVSAQQPWIVDVAPTRRPTVMVQYGPGGDLVGAGRIGPPTGTARAPSARGL